MKRSHFGGPAKVMRALPLPYFDWQWRKHGYVAIGIRSGGVHGENLWSLEVYPS